MPHQVVYSGECVVLRLRPDMARGWQLVHLSEEEAVSLANAIISLVVDGYKQSTLA